MIALNVNKSIVEIGYNQFLKYDFVVAYGLIS